MDRGFEWDPAKNLANVGKHGIDLADAIAIFEGLILERPDGRRDYGERRMVAIGNANGIEIVVYTLRAAARRTISARKARRNERRLYHAYIGQAAQAQQD
jgi:uncharacterized DUF497 family protein